MRAAAAYALAATIAWTASGCAHHPPHVTRRDEGGLVVGPYLAPGEWESAYAGASAERAAPASARELDAAIARGDRPDAARLARLLVDSTDARVQERVARALIDVEDIVTLERFVGRHATEPAFAASFEARLDLESPGIADAIARGLPLVPRTAPRIALAMARADRREEARAAIAIATPASADDFLALAEASLAIDDPDRALTFALAAYDHGASARALVAAEAAATRLGRDAEASALRARAEAALDGTVR